MCVKETSLDIVGMVKCKFKHNNETCVNQNCNVYDCERRHPKICNFQRDYGFFKFTTFCKYDHRKPKDIVNNCAKIKDLEKNFENSKNTLKEKDINVKVIGS